MPIEHPATCDRLSPLDHPGPHPYPPKQSLTVTTATRIGRGFTLVELLIAIAVIGILVRIAYPSYLSYMKRAHRSEVQSLMLDLANREQQYLLDNRSFLGGASTVSTLVPSGVPANVTAYYTVTITATAGPPPTFTITATPNSGTIMAGEAAFTLDQDGTKLPAGKWEGR
ncbi:MAG TPA: type IV pilin protein [Vicinamibacterales bacterium]|nr:type IV pilin protein [Vicinamibacterales bacterium]